MVGVNGMGALFSDCQPHWDTSRGEASPVTSLAVAIVRVYFGGHCNSPHHIHFLRPIKFKWRKLDFSWGGLNLRWPIGSPSLPHARALAVHHAHISSSGLKYRYLACCFTYGSMAFEWACTAFQGLFLGVVHPCRHTMLLKSLA